MLDIAKHHMERSSIYCKCLQTNYDNFLFTSNKNSVNQTLLINLTITKISVEMVKKIEKTVEKIISFIIRHSMTIQTEF